MKTFEAKGKTSAKRNFQKDLIKGALTGGEEKIHNNAELGVEIRKVVIPFQRFGSIIPGKRPKKFGLEYSIRSPGGRLVGGGGGGVRWGGVCVFLRESSNRGRKRVGGGVVYDETGDQQGGEDPQSEQERNEDSCNWLRQCPKGLAQGEVAKERIDASGFAFTRKNHRQKRRKSASSNRGTRNRNRRSDKEQLASWLVCKAADLHVFTGSEKDGKTGNTSKEIKKKN